MKKLLVYNMPDGHLEILEDIGKDLDYEIDIATNEDLGQRVGALLGEMEKIEVEEDFEPVDINFLMIHNFTDEELDELLMALRENELKIPNKCISTPTNKDWVFYELLKENKEEAELMPILHNLYAVRSAGIDLLNKGIEDPDIKPEIEKINELIASRRFEKEEMKERFNKLARIVNKHLA